MDKKFLKDNFGKLCLSNADLIEGEIKGIALYFTGLGHTSQPGNDMVASQMLAKRGILYILPFYNPWCWMNTKTVNYIDAMVDAARELFNIKDDAPIGIYGGSMGGHNTYLYITRTRHKVVAAVTLCPCCNMEYEMSFSTNTIFRSYFESALDDTDDFKTYMHENSPINMIDKLPKIPYRIAVGRKDMVLVPSQHGDLMVEKMLEAGLEAERFDYPEAAHCNITHTQRIAEHVWLADKMLG